MDLEGGLITLAAMLLLLLLPFLRFPLLKFACSQQESTGPLLFPGCTGMCRAHGIPHQRVTAVEDLGAALRSAWGCNRHSGGWSGEGEVAGSGARVCCLQR